MRPAKAGPPPTLSISHPPSVPPHAPTRPGTWLPTVRTILPSPLLTSVPSRLPTRLPTSLGSTRNPPPQYMNIDTY